MDTKEEALLKRIVNGGGYFYKMKPSQFHHYTEWPRLMALCKLISRYGEMVLEAKVADILMRPPVEQQTLPGSSDKTDNKKTTGGLESPPEQLPGQQALLPSEE